MIGEGQAVENAGLGCRIHYLNRGDNISVFFLYGFSAFKHLCWDLIESKYALRKLNILE